jgi:hypothetical protein
MSILRGKSVTYGRYVADVPATEVLGKIGHFSEITAGDDYTESFGGCSYRNLLDGPIDSGLVNGSEFHLLGLRLDKKKAPAQLVQATLARELYDAAVLGPLSKKRQKEIKEAVKLRLDREAKPKPSHGVLVGDTSRGLFYMDGPSGAQAILLDLIGFRPLYQDMPENRKFLAWMIWRGALSPKRSTELVFPMGSVTFREPGGTSSASFAGENIGGKLESYLKRGWEVARCEFMWNLDGEVANIMLDAATFKTTITFPEEVLKAEQPEDSQVPAVDWKLANRLAFISGFEASLAHELTEFLRRESGNALECDFEALFSSEGMDVYDQPRSGAQ